jgi:hypothetical protein
MSDLSDISMGGLHLTLSCANFPILDNDQWAIFEKMEVVNSTTATDGHLRKSPDEIVARVARFRGYEIVLEKHVTNIITAKMAAAHAASQATDPRPSITYAQSQAPPPAPA